MRLNKNQHPILTFINRIIILFILPVLFSCQGEDPSVPKVQFQAPYENQGFYATDTIRVMAHVSDIVPIEEIQIQVVDDQLVPVLPALEIVPFSPTYEMDVDIAYPLSDPNLASGVYYVLIRADNGSNLKKKYQKIQIYAVNKYLKGVCCIIEVPPNDIQLWFVDSLAQTSFLLDLPNHYRFSDVSSTYSQFINYDSLSAEADIYSSNDWNLSFNISTIFNPPFPDFIRFKYIGNSIWSSHYDEHIRSYSMNGQLQKSFNQSQGWYAQDLFIKDEFILSSERSKVGMQNRLAVYFKISGAIFNSLVHNLEVVSLIPRNDHEWFLFGNTRQGEGKIYIYSLNNNSLFEPYVLSVGQLNSVVEVAVDEFLISHDGKLKLYKYNSSSVTNYSGMSDVKRIRFNESTQYVYTANANSLSFFYYPSSSLMQTVNLPGEVLDIHLLFNRD